MSLQEELKSSLDMSAKMSRRQVSKGLAIGVFGGLLGLRSIKGALARDDEDHTPGEDADPGDTKGSTPGSKGGGKGGKTPTPGTKGGGKGTDKSPTPGTKGGGKGDGKTPTPVGAKGKGSTPGTKGGGKG